jgi:hypothetical protein
MYNKTSFFDVNQILQNKEIQGIFDQGHSVVAAGSDHSKFQACFNFQQ